MKSKRGWKMLVVLILIAGATVAVFSALAQGMAAGDQIGIPALEGSVHRLQRNSHFAMFTALILDVFAGILVAPWMPGKNPRGVISGSSSTLCLALQLPRLQQSYFVSFSWGWLGVAET
jgi:hypothetical protein